CASSAEGSPGRRATPRKQPAAPPDMRLPPYPAAPPWSAVRGFPPEDGFASRKNQKIRGKWQTGSPSPHSPRPFPPFAPPSKTERDRDEPPCRLPPSDEPGSSRRFFHGSCETRLPSS